jgi:hypothetical protein
MKPLEEKTKIPITAIQIYNAVIGTVMIGICSIILSVVWELKEWKGKKDQEDFQQNIVLANLNILMNERQRVSYIEAIMPKELKLVKKR